MSERLYQGRFDENFALVKPQEVTPPKFAGLYLPQGQRELSLTNQAGPEPGRFVREAQTYEAVTSPRAAAEYLLKNIYTPFEQRSLALAAQYQKPDYSRSHALSWHSQRGLYSPGRTV